MRCLIVSRTRKGTTACVGALVIESGQSLRLKESTGSFPAPTTYEIGQIWDLVFEPDEECTPPHNETVIVYRRALISTVPREDMRRFLTKEIGISIWRGSPDGIFDGYPHSTMSGTGYVSERTGLPDVSTGFWVSDRDLVLVQSSYEYQGSSGIRQLKYVGFDKALDVIPAGTLIRVSLAAWWCPPDWIDGEDRCYLQLSGWYI